MAEFSGSETIDKVAELLNEAAISTKDAVKLSNLKQVQELILRKDSNLLDNFLDEVLDFQTDKSPEIRKLVITFIEESCKKDAETIFKVIDNFRFLLYDENINVQKKAILSMINIFKCTIKCVFKHKLPVDDEQYQTWISILDIKSHIISLLDSDNDGIRTLVIKFIETLIILFSPRIKESLVPAPNDQDFSIDQIDKENQLLDRAALAEEGRDLMRRLLKYTLSTHISSVNLIASICSLSNIARQRPEFMEVVLETYSKLIGNMPPTLGKSQVSTVRKQLKLQLAFICKNHCCLEFVAQITTILTDLGASNNEIAKILPKSSNLDGRLKRGMSSSEMMIPSVKKFKLQANVMATNEEQEEEKSMNEKTEASSDAGSIEDLIEKLQQKENITDLVIVSMAFLPEQIPANFKENYKPVANPGSENQIRHLAKLVRQQLIDANLVKKPKFEVSDASEMGAIDDIYVEEENENEDLSSFSMIKTLKGKSSSSINDTDDDSKEKLAADSELNKHQQSFSKSKIRQISMEKVMQPPSKKTNKMFKLNEITNEQMSLFSTGTMEKLLCQAKDRIFNGEESLLKSAKEASIVRKKIIVNLSNVEEFQKDLVEYIFDDPRKRIDIALLMIYNSYIKFKKSQANFDRRLKTDNENEVEHYENEMNSNMIYYDQIVYKLFNCMQQKQDHKEMLFSRFICLLPHLSESILRLLKNSCLEETNKLSYLQTLNTLSDLIVTRFAQRENLLKILLDLTHQNQVSIRENAIGIALNLYERTAFKPMIQEFSTQRLRYLLLPNPSPELFVKVENNQNEMITSWDEDTIKSCLYLFLELIAADHSNIHCLSEVYLASSPEVKKVILKMIDHPIRKMGMESSELLKFLQNFSNGSETLVLRIIHILTEKSPPTLELINKVRDLYATKLPDVRFLIPILTSLTKAEIIVALPQLIKLSQPVVKEVFNRLLGINVNLPIHKSPVSPAELLVALHQIDSPNCDIKSVIYATSICFSETKIYTQEILAAVIKQLIELNPIPTLFMRTIIQSLQVYPKLSSFIVIMMQRLIGKQIWKYPKIWEGFIKCCQILKSASQPILLQLPSAQLKEVFSQVPELKDHVCKFVQANPGQRQTISKDNLEIIDQENLNTNKNDTK